MALRMMRCPHCQTTIQHCPCCGGRLSSDGSQETQSNHARLAPLSSEGLNSFCRHQPPASVPVAAKSEPQFVINLEPKGYSIGRGDTAAGVFPDIDLSRYDAGSLASRKHARIAFRDGRFFIEDIGSLNGTFLLTESFRVRLEPSSPCVLHDGDVVRFGGVDVKFNLPKEITAVLPRTSKQHSRVTTELV